MSKLLGQVSRVEKKVLVQTYFCPYQGSRQVRQTQFGHMSKLSHFFLLDPSLFWNTIFINVKEFENLKSPKILQLITSIILHSKCPKGYFESSSNKTHCCSFLMNGVIKHPKQFSFEIIEKNKTSIIQCTPPNIFQSFTNYSQGFANPDFQ